MDSYCSTVVRTSIRGLSNEQVVETVSERFGLSKEELEKWL